MRRYLPVLLGLAGLALLTVAGALIHPIIGIALAGLSLILVAVTVSGAQ